MRHASGFWSYQLPLVSFFLLLAIILVLKPCHSASAPPIKLDEHSTAIDDGPKNVGHDRQKLHISKPVAFVCARPTELSKGELHPAMAYMYQNDLEKRKKCESKSSKILLEYRIPKDDVDVSFEIFQKGCSERFPRARENFRKGGVSVSRSKGTASVELFVPSGILEGPLVEFCLEATLSDKNSKIQTKTNVSTRVFHRAKNCNEDGPREHSVIIMLVESITLEKVVAPKPLISSATTPSNANVLLGETSKKTL